MSFTEEKEEIRKEFQLERVILFSDAVFAIIITIMVLDIRLPEAVKSMNVADMAKAFKDLIPKVFAYALSFYLVANFWIRHLKIFSFLKDYNMTLIILNLVFLFSVSLFPFASTLISGEVHLHQAVYGWAVNIYLGVTLLTFFIQNLLTLYLFKNQEELCLNKPMMDSVLLKKVQVYNVYLIPLLGVGIYILNAMGINPVFGAVFLGVLGLVRSLVEKKYYPESNTGPMIVRAFFFISKQRRHKQKNICNETDIDPTA